VLKSTVVVGGGINGMCIARSLVNRGYQVTLIDQGKLGQATTSNSSRLLHGGLRYLEQGQIKFVWEALEQRSLWLKRYPQHVRVVEKFVPCYRNKGRNRVLVWLGVKLYNMLAGRSALGPVRWWAKSSLAHQIPSLSLDACVGAVSYFDLMMDDQALLTAIRSELDDLGVEIIEDTSVDRLRADGEVVLVGGERLRASVVVNAAGPWASQLLSRSNIRSDYQLEYNRGIHLLIDRPCERACVLQQEDGRIVFALPLKDKTLFGTTETKLLSVDEQRTLDGEILYLKRAFETAFLAPLNDGEIVKVTSGIRPIVKPAIGTELSAASREAVIERTDRVITAFGGKWTSAPQLAEEVASMARNILPLEESKLRAHLS